MTRGELTSELTAAPGNELIVWAALYEDVYETVYGDGYYAYLADAFFTREEVERFADTPSDYRFHIRRVRLALDAGRIHCLSIDLRPSETIDEDAVIDVLSHDPTPRGPKTQY